MANHTDDCPHCGNDRRAYGTRFCCDAAERESAEMRATFRAEQLARGELLKQLGITARQSPHYSGEWETLPETASLFAFLRSLS